MNNPLLYQINTRILLQERSVELGRPATLEDVPDSLLDWLADQGFEWVWFLGLWRTGKVGREISRTNPALRSSYSQELPDFTDADICGSPFAVQSYTANPEFGGDEALARLRFRMSRRGLRLMLDFVVNHCAPDHPWVSEHPECSIRGNEEDLVREPQNYGRFRAGGEDIVLAYGRDPYFPSWPDTLQLNYRHPGCRQAMMDEILSIAERCDGVRCDMAMLVQPQVFMHTWGDRALPADGSPPDDTPFWLQAISRVREEHPGFLFTAEVYWDMEWELQQAGFDFTYDKSLYDRLRHGWGKPVREHLLATDSYQEHSLRFLENHYEPSANPQVMG
jgi:glycosidase